MGPGRHVLACSSFSGELVRDAQGAPAGTLAHVVIDVATGRIAYAVLARGGVFGLGAQHFAVPWQALRFDPEQACFVLQLSPERLERVPELSQ